eukprot:gene7835-9304_t
MIEGDDDFVLYKETFDSNEIILAWNPDATDASNKIPKEQYEHLKVALAAQLAKRRRVALNEQFSRDDGNSDEEFENARAEAVVPMIEAEGDADRQKNNV